MDQIRAILKVMWKQRFWILSVMAVVIALVCWSMAASDLDAKFAQRKTAIQKAFSDMQSLSGQQTYHNNDVIAADKKEVDIQKVHVLDLWKNLYERQRSAVLSWPKELGDEFTDYIDKRKFGDSISIKMRTIYQNYIENRIDGLLDIVKAQKIEGTAGAGGYGGGEFGGRGGYGGEGGRGGGYGGEYGGGAAYQPAGATGAAEDEDYLVQWLDQDNLRAKLFFDKKPSAMEIWVTQEDLWVYETLLNVIAKTNEARKATRPDNTAVRAILALEVGQAASLASSQPGRVYIPVASSGGMGEGGYGGEMGGYGGEGGGYGGRGGEGGYGGEFGGGMGGYGGEGMEGGGDELLLGSRYLGEDGTPLPAGDPESFGTEYRQLPIRMNLMMDQRWLPRLLVECANSPLPIEVNQVRVNPDKSEEGFGQQGGMMGGGYSTNLDIPASPYLAQVEIKGVVYIYMQPNEEQLGSPSGEIAEAEFQ
ncbi:hypothetical protein [Bythopirellula polymerisocia]|uniref:Uncharacterized protein n=1 Tax=Bythopirellula polymerisocia TaxID=2528003 RepID=A0A5C6CXK6_9BACT|nr:hypothetical protein [Bythopirellula polymerisocia]TWU28267.1 hypothetical protein Pla144_15540 [Bythopirellula polymerisocia]